MKGIKISVIIPAYNVEKYIGECLDSVLKQTLRGIEIICIDDGSLDATKEIISQYCEIYNNIFLIEQENSGSGIARNKGILKATGKYVVFMDADDFYPDIDILEFLYKRIEMHQGLMCGGSMSIFSEGIVSSTGLRKGYAIAENEIINSEDYETFGGYTRFAYRRSFLIENNIFFPPYRRCQDPPFFISAIAKAKKIYCFNKVTYCYRKNHKVVVFDANNAVDYARGMRDSLEIAKKNNLIRIYNNLIKELPGEPAAMIYKYVAEGIPEMEIILRDINELIASGENDTGINLLNEEQAKEFVKEIPQRKKFFLEKLYGKEKIYLYGAGTIGRKVLKFLEEEKIHVDSFLVSNKADNPDIVLGLKVKTPQEVQSFKDEAVIIVSTFSYLQQEIADFLRKMDFKNLIFIDLKEFYLFSESINH